MNEFQLFHQFKLSYLSNPIIQLSHGLMRQLRAPFLLGATAEVILLFTSDGEGVEQLRYAASHVGVQD